MDIISIFFDWPNGTVWSNIIASIIWSIPTVLFAFWRIRAHQNRNHKEVMDKVNQIHAKVNE